MVDIAWQNYKFWIRLGKWVYSKVAVDHFPVIKEIPGDRDVRVNQSSGMTRVIGVSQHTLYPSQDHSRTRKWTSDACGRKAERVCRRKICTELHNTRDGISWRRGTDLGRSKFQDKDTSNPYPRQLAWCALRQ